MYRVSDSNNVDSLLLTQITAAQTMPFAVNLSVGSGTKFAQNVPNLVVLSLIGETETGSNGVIEVFEYDEINGDVMTLSARAISNTDALDWPVGSKVQFRLVDEHIEQILEVLDDPKTANTFLAGPSSGGPDTPGFRTLVASDVPPIQNLNGTLTIAKGGSGLSSVTAGAILIGDGTDPMVEVVGSSSGEVLTWNGTAWEADSAPAGTPHALLSATHSDTTAASVVRGDVIVGKSGPTWQRLPIGSANRSLLSDGTDVSWGQVSLSAGVTSTLPVANGGTGLTTATTGDIVYASASNTFSKLGIGGSGQVLSVSGGIPAWVNISSLSLGSHTHSGADIVSGVVAQAYGGTGMTSYTAGAMIYANGSGNLTTLPIGSNGQILTIVGGVPVWAASGSGAGTVTSVDIGTGTTGLTATGGPITTSGTINLAGTLAVAHGGTNQTSYTAGDILYATAGTTLAKLAIGTAGQVLTVSGGAPAWTSAGAGTVTSVDIDPDTTGLTFTGGPITTSGDITVGGTLVETHGGTGLNTYATGDIIYASGVDTLAALPAGADGEVLTLASGVPTWASVSGVGAHDLLSADHSDTIASAVTRGSIIVGQGGTPKWAELPIGLANRYLASDGTDVSWGQVSLAAGVTGTLPVTSGGTGMIIGAIGDILYFDSTTTLAKRNIGSSGDVLTVSGGVPTWAAPASGDPDFYKDDGTTPTDALTASGTDSLALGSGATATGGLAIAIGKARAAGGVSMAINIGDNTTSTGTRGANPWYGLAYGQSNYVNNSAGDNAKYSAVVGGSFHALTQQYGSIWGGLSNTVNASGSNLYSVIVGGTGSINSGHASGVLGGTSNTINAAASNSAAIGGTNNVVHGDQAVALGGIGLLPTGYAQIMIGRYAYAMPPAASSAWNAADPVLICGNGSANVTSSSSNSFYFTGNSIFNLGGQETAGGTGAAGNTGIIQLGFTGEATRAKITLTSHAADRTYTLPDYGANANIILASGGASNQTLRHNGTKPVWTSTLDVPVATVTGNTTLDDTHSYVRVNNGAVAVTISLPDATTCPGRWYRVKRLGSANVTIDPSGAQTVEGAATYVLSISGMEVGIISNGANWDLE